MVQHESFHIHTPGFNYFGIQTEDVSSSRPNEILKRGRIFVRRSLENLADRTVFDMRIRAQDKGVPTLEPGFCRVLITVSKGVQDLKPKWDDLLSSRVYINEVLSLVLASL